MIRRILKRRFLVFVLILSILPGWPELLENVEHLLHDGHLAHSAQHDEAADEGHDDVAEHGCTPMAHHCGCHTSVLAVLQDPTVSESGKWTVPDTRGFWTEWSPLTRAIPPPTRPPIG